MKRYIYIIAIVVACLISGCRMNDLEDSSVENYYKDGIKQYLVEKLKLEEYDLMLEMSTMNYIPNDDENKTEVQKNGDLGLKYIYLRNEIHIERLSEKELDIIKNEMKKNDGHLSETMKQIIESTYVKVISPKEIITEDDKNVLTFYDNAIEPQFVSMNSIVFKIATMEEYDADGNYVDFEHEKLKEQAICEFARNMEMSLEGQLGEIPIRVFADY